MSDSVKPSDLRRRSSVVTYHIHASTRDGHYLGCVPAWSSLGALWLAGAASLLLPGCRFRIENEARKP